VARERAGDASASATTGPTPRAGWTRRDVLRAGAATASLLLPACTTGSGGRPNILLIVADDLGLECLGAYGGTTFSTPNVDVLATDGMRFTSAFATPACATSRAEILTGRYPFRTGWIDNAGPLSPPSLLASEPTFARTLRDAGYATAIAGKWQLGSIAERPSMPQESGFDESCCWSLERVGKQLRPTPDNSRYFAPRLWRNGVKLDHERDPSAYAPDIELAFLCDFVARHPKQPFLAYHALNLPHAPYHVPPGRKLPPMPDDEKQRMAIGYGLMISYMDELVGRYARVLTEQGIARDTLVLFTSDNGGNENFVVKLEGREIQGGKFTLGESGTNVPFVARQVGAITAGSVCEELVDFTDVLTTFADLGRAPLPQGVVLDGHSFAAPLHGTGKTTRAWVYCQLGFNAFIRNRHWRLATDGHLFRVAGTYADEPVDPRTDPAAQAAYDELRAALLELVGKDAKRVHLSDALLRGEGLAPVPAPDADRRS
jgi:arylsulfatase A